MIPETLFKGQRPADPFACELNGEWRKPLSLPRAIPAPQTPP